MPSSRNTTPIIYQAAAAPEYLTLPAAATYCGLSADTIRRRIRDGQLPARKTSKQNNARIVIRRSDLEAMLAPIVVADSLS